MQAWVATIGALAGLAVPAAGGLSFIDTSFENASPVWWEEKTPGEVDVYLAYDHERDSPNRAAGHWHFALEAEPGTRLTVTLNNFDNVWNGKPGVPVSDATLCTISEDGRNWTRIETEIVDGNRLRFEVDIATGRLYVAHLEPYRISDLEALLDEVRAHPLVRIETVGRTVQGRPLEVVRVGRADAPSRVFLRARAHPWEPGGNWVAQGLVRALLDGSPESAACLDRYAVYTMPMANKDGVALGRTRFNLRGKDLNRDWDEPADPRLAPENHALEQWLAETARRGQTPDLVIDLHNDQSGKIHVSRPDVDLDAYLADIDRYERLMREHTWFTEGRTGGSFRNPGTIGEGLLERFGVTALVQELNANWVAGLDLPATAENWELLGRQYRRVFLHYFAPTSGQAQNPEQEGTPEPGSLPTAREIAERVRAAVNCEWGERSNDTFKAGDPDVPVTGVAVAFMSTQRVLERAVAAGCNLVVTHEPTFYAGNDDASPLGDDPVVGAKRAYLEEQGLVVWRFHDHAHRHGPDLIDEGMIDALGARDGLTSKSPFLWTVPETTVRDFAAELKSRLGARSVDIVGDPAMRFTRAALTAGARSSVTQMQLLQRGDVEVLVAGETREWETVPYVQDATTQGRHKALVLLGHANSEDAGMEYVADWLRQLVPDVPVRYIRSGDPFTDAGGPAR